MKRYAVAYGLWLTGVITAAALAWFYYRKVLAIGEVELGKVLSPDGARSPQKESAAGSSPPPAEPPASEDGDEFVRRRGVQS